MCILCSGIPGCVRVEFREWGGVDFEIAFGVMYLNEFRDRRVTRARRVYIYATVKPFFSIEQQVKHLFNVRIFWNPRWLELGVIRRG